MKKLVTALFFTALIALALPAAAQKKSKESKEVKYEYVSIIKYQTYRLDVKELQQMTLEGDRFRRPGGEMLSAQFGTAAFEYHIEVLNEEERNNLTEAAMSARSVTQLLNVLGEYGFSLCGNSSLAHEEGLEVHTYILKRPKK